MHTATFLNLSAIPNHFIRGRRTSGQPRRITHTKKCKQVSRKNTIPVVDVTTATFCVYTNLKSFLQLRLKNKKLQKEQIPLLSVGQPMRAVSAHTYGRFFIRSVSNLILAKLPPAKPPTHRRGTPVK